MAIGTIIHLYELDIMNGSSKAVVWNARNRQRPATIVAPIRARGLLENDMAVPQNHVRKRSIALGGLR